ncbi:MAG TPA: alcohol dehydrogenase [Planctomycetaceae bacterium]|nr:alcohol dehydrogenase [Blastopirellula sp.]HAY79357.1 alcohol dehydrogenase [Planctomycetaceae bacterium]
MRFTWNFFSAAQLTYGPGSIRQLGQLVADRGIARAFIVSDRHLAAAGIIKKTVESLESAQVVTHVFDGGQAEPELSIAQAASAAARDFGPDAILGLGGGSNMDLAKLTAVLTTHGGEPQQYFGFDNVPGPVLPLICIPTTAGTGSEVSHAAVVTDTASNIKVSTLSRHLRPTLALVDPTLTYTCPQQVAADSGIDALTHAIEGYTATDYRELNVPEGEAAAYDGSHPLGDVLAEKAIKLIGEHLVAAVKEPENHAAKDAMALAATLAGLAFSNCGVALVHALEYPIGAAVHCSHGAGNGMLLPYVMRYNMPQREAKFAKIAELLGADTRGLSQSEAAAFAVEQVIQLRSDIGIPHRIRDFGECQDQLGVFASKAFAIKRLMDVNPRRPTEADLLALLEEAY